MTRTVLILATLSALTLCACGVNGQPQPPLNPDGSAPPRVKIEGETRVGVSGNF